MKTGFKDLNEISGVKERRKGFLGRYRLDQMSLKQRLKKTRGEAFLSKSRWA
ncbi:hypothetical protein Plhal304r1_c008g0032321 [Plasmopara halstedii]